MSTSPKEKQEAFLALISPFNGFTLSPVSRYEKELAALLKQERVTVTTFQVVPGVPSRRVRVAS